MFLWYLYFVLDAEISRLTGARVIAPYYSLAPERLWPCQLLEMFALYKDLLGEGIEPNRIVVVGEIFK